uniref:Metalloprotease n=1 Tax=Tityus melici TaxID=3026321 RepID=A0AA49QCN4_9SCOR|nr:putative metalloprotease [Tityus melici]
MNYSTMIYLASIFVFASVSDIPTGREDVVFPWVETSRSGVKTIKFRALGEDIELKLEPAGDILAEGFALFDSNNQKQSSVDVENLRKRIYRDSVNGAALLIDDDEFLSIQGIVNSKLRIAPHESRELNQYRRRAHRIVELTNDKNSSLRDDVISRNIQRQIENFASMSREDKCIVVESLCVTESRFTRRFKTDQALTEYVTLMFTGAQNMYDTMNLGIKLRLIGVQAFATDNQPSFIKNNEVKNGKYLKFSILDDMNSYYCKNATSLAKDADIIILIITRTMVLMKGSQIENEAVGLALGGGACLTCEKSLVMADETDYNERTISLAHEAAHLLAVPHDGDDFKVSDIPNSPGAKSCRYGEGYIMGTSIGPNMLKFSKCSIACAKYFLSLPQASCLYEDCPSSAY